METESLFNEDWEPPSTTAMRPSPADGMNPFPITPSKSKVISISRRPRPAFRVGEAALEFRLRHFPDLPEALWNDWHWQVANRVTDSAALSRFLSLSEGEARAISSREGGLPLAVTPYYLSLVSPHDPADPLRRTVIPSPGELAAGPGEADDPLHEDGKSPVPGLVHRYPDRVLFLVTGFCSTYCRYCTRSRMVGHAQRKRLGRRDWEAAIDYIARTPSVRDVLISGGDPLTLSDGALSWLLTRLRAIPHVEVVRIGTKVPMVLPQRVTPALVRMLKGFHPLWLSVHAAHPSELGPETAQALSRLADAGIPLGSQTVLLSGINDSVEVMKGLMQGLMRLRVRPYYIYQCDPITGSAHFRTPVERGLEILRGLRGHTSGYAVPSFVVDAPGGGGKIPLLPDSVRGWDNEGLVLENYEGRLFRYPDFRAGA